MIEEAQFSMRCNYINGGPGVIISGLVWLVAAIITKLIGFDGGMIAFFIGGILIHPVSVMISSHLNQEGPP